MLRSARARAGTSENPDVPVNRMRAGDVGTYELAELLSPSLFADERIVVLEAAAEAGKDAVALIASAAADVPSGTVLVVVHSGGGRAKALATELQSLGAVVHPCARISKASERVDFVRKEFRALRVKVDEDTVTALLDAVYRAIHETKKARNPRKALLIISDGGDNNSRYTEGEIKNLVKEADVQIYAIGIYEPIGARSRTPEELMGPGLLTQIAEQTGGRQYAIENVNELADVATKIGVELRNQYILGYAPRNQQRDGKYRRVQVKLNQPKGLPPLRAYWRMGYYAPTE